jgi:hypothetical protein
VAAREQKEVYLGGKDKVREKGVGGALELQGREDGRMRCGAEPGHNGRAGHGERAGMPRLATSRPLM